RRAGARFLDEEREGAGAAAEIEHVVTRRDVRLLDQAALDRPIPDEPRDRVVERRQPVGAERWYEGRRGGARRRLIRAAIAHRHPSAGRDPPGRPDVVSRPIPGTK